ncbi:MAG: DUF998 domain-containing protein, partial [Pseudomonadota bacterium]
MNKQAVALTGVAAAILFGVALAVFAAVRPEYSHAHKAVSELGVIGAPNALAWNLIGFITPGILLALCGAALAQAVDGSRKVLWYLLVLAGIGFAATGIFPAEMRNGDPVMQSPLTVGVIVVLDAGCLVAAVADAPQSTVAYFYVASGWAGCRLCSRQFAERNCAATAVAGNAVHAGHQSAHRFCS